MQALHARPPTACMHSSCILAVAGLGEGVEAQGGQPTGPGQVAGGPGSREISKRRSLLKKQIPAIQFLDPGGWSSRWTVRPPALRHRRCRSRTQMTVGLIN